MNSVRQVHIPPPEAVAFFKSAKVGGTVKISGIQSKTVDLLFASLIICHDGTATNIPPQKKEKRMAHLSDQ